MNPASPPDPTSWLAFVPRDTVFVRDGRPFDAATDATAQTVRPSPTTIAGAIGYAFGIDPVKLRERPDGREIRGPVLARRYLDQWEPYFPVPADLVVTTDRRRVFRLRPEPADGKTDLQGGPRCWLQPPEDAGPVEPLRGWIPGEVLAEYLTGNLPAPDGTDLADLRHIADPLVPEPRVGLAREDRRARTGYLYQATHLRPDGDWGFLAEYATPGQAPPEPRRRHVPFGGKGRLADLEPAAMSWPVMGAPDGRVLVYLATPAVWPGGWELPVPHGASLIAAATSEPEPAVTVTPGAGWQASRALRWAVPAGSVYLLEFTVAAVGARWARDWHGVALDRGVSGDRRNDLVRTAGFGVALTGAWT